MASYSLTKTYLLFFRDNLVGSITSAQLGLGWITGFFNPSPTFRDYQNFFIEYDETENNPEEMLPKLEKKYGKAVLDPRNWMLKDNSGKRLNESIPYIFGDMISWRGAC